MRREATRAPQPNVPELAASAEREIRAWTYAWQQDWESAAREAVDVFENPGTGQVDMGARFYNPKTGGFGNQDTAPGAASPATPGLHGYAGDNPMTLTDLSGHSPSGSSSAGTVTKADVDATAAQAQQRAAQLKSEAARAAATAGRAASSAAATARRANVTAAVLSVEASIASAVAAVYYLAAQIELTVANYWQAQSDAAYSAFEHDMAAYWDTITHPWAHLPWTADRYLIDAGKELYISWIDGLKAQYYGGIYNSPAEYEAEQREAHQRQHSTRNRGHGKHHSGSGGGHHGSGSGSGPGVGAPPPGSGGTKCLSGTCSSPSCLSSLSSLASCAGHAAVSTVTRTIHQGAQCLFHGNVVACAETAANVVVAVGTDGTGDVAIGLLEHAGEDVAAQEGDSALLKAAEACLGGESFTASTKVLLANGKAVPISHLKPGDKVLATSTTTGKTQPETNSAPKCP